MTRRIVKMIEVKEVIYRWCQGVGKKTMQRSLGLARNTIREIINQALGLGLTRTSAFDEIEKITDKLQQMRNLKKQNPSSVQVKLKLHHEQIKDWLDMPYMTVTQMIRLFAEQNHTVSETSLRTYVRNNFNVKPKTTVHMATTPGQQAQVDFGYVGLMIDPKSKKMRKTHAFIMTLSHSRHRFVHFVFRQDALTWIDCHIRAFNFFGGVPHTIILDNLKAGVIKPDIYDPIVNRAYGELERHYSFVVDPAKVRVAKHKGKVERSVTIIKQQLVAGRDYKSIDDANAKALIWCNDDIAHKITRTTGKTPMELFIKEDKHALKPLPLNEFEFPIWQEALVHRDQHIVFMYSFYSVPHQYVNQTVWVRGTLHIIQIFVNEKLIKTHPRATEKGQWVTDQLDYPEHARIFLEQDAPYCLAKAKEMGTSVDQFLTCILTPPSLTRRRKAQAVLRLAEIYGKERLEAACKRALQFDNLKLRSLKKILEDELDKLALPEEGSPLPIHNTTGMFLRNPNEFKADNDHTPIINQLLPEKQKFSICNGDIFYSNSKNQSIYDDRRGK